MNNFFNELKKYFESTSRDKILEDWSKSKEFDEVGPTVEDFLYNSNIYQVQTIDPDIGQNQNILNKFNPEYPSGFLLTKNFIFNAKSSFFTFQLSISKSITRFIKPQYCRFGS